jgi:DNA repair protein RecN (Recombination protein N)
MLRHIFVKDLAVVESLELDLEPGMTVLTGETGAGKSILIDALALALGEKADAGMIRAGCTHAEVNAELDLGSIPDAWIWLKDRALEDADGQCILRRVLPRQGRSKSYINGRPVPLQSLRELGDLLVDILGQHAHQSLLRRDFQRQLLDDYADHQSRLRELASLHRNWRQVSERLAMLGERGNHVGAHRELLAYQAQELQGLGLTPGEVDELEEEYRRLSHAERLMGTCQEVLERVYEHDELSVQSLLNRSIRDLQQLEGLDPPLGTVRTLLEGARIQVDEAAAELRDHAGNLALDPQRQRWVEERLGAIHDLSRKHRVEPEELTARLTQMEAELQELERLEEAAGSLNAELRRLLEAYQRHAAELSAARVHAAEELSQRVTETMQQLGMPEGSFRIECAADSDRPISPHGIDRVRFLVATNPGQTPDELTRVASGGELSRISLAIQVVAARSARIPTMIFDEVDVGIGGGVAEIVGRQLRKLGQTRQVICITHLPQVAAQGHHHCQVEKQSDLQGARTTIRLLGSEGRIEELARMLGGVEVSSQARAHAREMLVVSDRAGGG